MKTLKFGDRQAETLSPRELDDALRSAGFDMTEGDAKPFVFMRRCALSLKGNVNVSFEDNGATVVIRQE